MGRTITLGILVLTAVMMAVGTWRSVGQGVPVSEALREMLVFSISLAVGAIPEGLPAIVTIALAIGVERMRRGTRSSASCRRGDARLPTVICSTRPVP